MIVPLTMACLLEASSFYDIDSRVFEAIRIAEGGKVGHVVRNTDGTYDLGPFQINTRWLRIFRSAHHPMDPVQIAQNGCVNAYVAAYILRRNMDEGHENLWVAVGHYHSHNPREARKYRLRVYRILRRLSSIEKTKGVSE